jgi:hypothetical protein
MFKLNSRFRSALLNFNKIPLNKRCLVLTEEELDKTGDRKEHLTMPLRHLHHILAFKNQQQLK